MPNASTNRIRHDHLGAAEVSVRCSCVKDGTLAVLSLTHFMKIGRNEALRLADSLCPRCSRSENHHAATL
jgi:hypothetical protein